MKTGIFLQVRLDSNRLPKKALIDICGKSCIVHAMESLRLVDADIHALVTDEASLEELRPIANECGFRIIAGPDEDVLKRYIIAGQYFGTQVVVRATGDNPLVSPALAGKIIRYHIKNKADYSGFLGIPLGTGVEVYSIESLIRADKETVSLYDREHVSPYILNHPETFMIKRPYAENKYCFPEGRVTLDTYSDLDYIRSIYEDIYTGTPIEIEALLRWLLQRESTVLRETKQLPVKSC